MGYYSYFNVLILDENMDALLSKDPKYVQVEFYLFQNPMNDFNSIAQMKEDSFKWYDWEDDFKGLSMIFPELTFEVDREGEGRGDHQRIQFKNGDILNAWKGYIEWALEENYG